MTKSDKLLAFVMAIFIALFGFSVYRAIGANSTEEIVPVESTITDPGIVMPSPEDEEDDD